MKKVFDNNYLNRYEGLVDNLDENEELYNALAAEDKAVIEAITIIYNALNHGQQKKLVKDETVRALFDRYGLSYEEVIE